MCGIFLFMYSLFLYDAILSMIPHTNKIVLSTFSACPSTSLSFAADDSFSVSSSLLQQPYLF